MQTVIFIAAYEEDKLVELHFLRGGFFHIYIDRHYLGMILYRSVSGWDVIPQTDGYFNSGDIEALLDRAGV